MRFWIPGLAALAVVIGALNLMLWQLERARDKQGLLESMASAPELTLAEIGPDTPRFSRVGGTGSFDAGRQVLLDNQVRNGVAGVHVFTPFEPAGSDALFLVNRGWWPMPDRRRPPDPKPPASGTVRIEGMLNDPPRVGVQIGRAGPLDAGNWPNLVTYYDHARLVEAFGERLEPRIIQLDPGHPAHTSGDGWQAVNFGPERHRAYAFQWGAIAAAVSVIWLLLSGRVYLRRTRRAP